MDSAALVCHYLKKGYTIWPLYVHAGLGWEKAEYQSAVWFLRRLSSPNVNNLIPLALNLEHAYDKNWSRTGRTPGARSSDRAVFLPARNLLLIVRAFLHLYPKGVHRLALATLKMNPFLDGQRSYFDQLEKVLSASFKKPVMIETPFRNLDKKDLLLRNRDCSLHLSFSCLRPAGYQHCGRCNKCAERKKAFRRARLGDLTSYKS